MLLARPGFPAMLLGTHIERLLRDLVGDRRIEDCTTARLHLAVTNLRTSRVEIRDRGPLVETIMASCALPGFLAPRLMDGELLWDGGLGSVVPVEQWIDDPAITHIVAHSLVHDGDWSARATRPERLNFPGAMMIAAPAHRRRTAPLEARARPARREVVIAERDGHAAPASWHFRSRRRRRSNGPSTRAT